MAPPMSRPTVPRRSPIEAAVWAEFTNVGRAGYQVIGCCSYCGAHGYVAGRTSRSRICVTCFEFEFDNTHPSEQTIETRRQR